MVFLKLLIWLVAVVIAVVAVWGGLRREREEIVGVKGGSIFVAVLAFIIAAMVNACFGQVPAGSRGIVLQFGAPTGQVNGEGFYMVFPPFIRTVELMTVQVNAYETQAEAASKDLQIVTAKVTFNYSVDPHAVVKVYRELRHEYVERIIKPAIQEAVKASTATFTAEELITRRPAIRDAMNVLLSQRLTRFGIQLAAMSITDFNFSESFNSAIEAKVTAQQQALKAERDLQRIKTEAQQKIESAKAEAEALRVQKENVTPELLRLRTIEVQRTAIEKWNGVLPIVVTAGGPVPILDVFQMDAFGKK